MADPKPAVVYVNSHAQFPMIDALDGTRFEAGEPKKVADNRWIQAQVNAGVLYYCDADGVSLEKPAAPAAEKAAAPASAPAPAPAAASTLSTAKAP